MVGAESEMRLVNNLLVRQEEPCGQLHAAPRAQLLMFSETTSEVVLPRGDSSKSGLEGVCCR